MPLSQTEHSLIFNYAEFGMFVKEMLFLLGYKLLSSSSSLGPARPVHGDMQPAALALHRQLRLDFHQLRGQNLPNLRHHCRCLMNNSCPFLHLLRILSSRVFSSIFLEIKIFIAINCIGKQYTTIQYTRPRARCVQPVTSLKIKPIVERISVSQTCHFHPIFADFFVKFLPPYRDFEQTKFHIQEEITFPSQTYRIRHN